MTRCRYTARFLAYLKDLDRKPRERVYKTIDKFQNNPSLPGLNLEKLSGHESLWSIRITGGDRILLSKAQDEEGEIWVFENAGPHDIYRRT